MSGQCVSKFGRVLAPSNPYKEEDSPIVPVALDNLKIYVDPANTLSYRLTGRVLRDLSGSGYNGSVGSGDPIYRFSDGGVFEWDLAYTQYWSFGNPSDIEPTTNSVTFLIWANAYSGTSFSHTLVRKRFFTDSSQVWIAHTMTGGFSLILGTGTGSLIARVFHGQDRWGMFGMSYSPGSPGTGTGWYNGSSVGSSNITLSVTTDPWSIGTANSISTGTGWYGKVGLFAMWNKFLTTTEVSQFYELTRRRYGV